MAFHSKKDFAGLCGLKTKELAVYIKRNKVVLSGDYIDDSIEVNRDFLLKYKNRKAMRKVPISNRPEEKQDKPKSPPPNIQDPEYQPDDDFNITNDEGDEGSADPSKSMYTLNKKRLKVEIAKKTRETEILKLREQKIKGEIVPIDIIKNLFSLHTQSIISAQKDGIEELLINLSGEMRLSSEQLGRLRGKMVDILNNAVDKAIIITQRSMKVVVKEFTVKKDVGEHD